MKLYAEPSHLADWVNDAQLGDTTWFKPRKILWSRLGELLHNTPTRTSVRVDFQDFVALKSFLLSRNPDLSDDKRLAFETALNEISHAIELKGADTARRDHHNGDTESEDDDLSPPPSRSAGRKTLHLSEASTTDTATSADAAKVTGTPAKIGGDSTPPTAPPPPVPGNKGGKNSRK